MNAAESDRHGPRIDEKLSRHPKPRINIGLPSEPASRMDREKPGCAKEWGDSEELRADASKTKTEESMQLEPSTGSTKSTLAELRRDSSEPKTGVQEAGEGRSG